MPASATEPIPLEDRDLTAASIGKLTPTNLRLLCIMQCKTVICLLQVYERGIQEMLEPNRDAGCVNEVTWRKQMMTGAHGSLLQLEPTGSGCRGLSSIIKQPLLQNDV